MNKSLERADQPPSRRLAVRRAGTGAWASAPAEAWGAGRQWSRLPAALPGDRQLAAPQRQLEAPGSLAGSIGPGSRRIGRRSALPVPITLSERSLRTRGATPRPRTDSAKRTRQTTIAASCLTGPWSADAGGANGTRPVAIPAKVLEIRRLPTGADVADLSDHDLVNSTALPTSLEGSALSKAIDP